MALAQAGGTAETHLHFLSQLAPVPCREDVPLMAERHFHRTGNAVEVGVYRGGFSKHALSLWSGRYWMVDAWSHRKDGSNDKNRPEPEWHQQNFDLARRAVQPHLDRATLVRRLSAEAAQNFSDGFFDCVCAHACRALATRGP